VQHAIANEFRFAGLSLFAFGGRRRFVVWGRLPHGVCHCTRATNSRPLVDTALPDPVRMG